MTEQEKIQKAIKYFMSVRDGAKAVLDNGFGIHKGESTLVYDNRTMYADMAINALEEQEKRRWIPCSERLPEEEKEYWCAMKKGYESVLEFSNDLYKVDIFAFIQFKGKKQKGFYTYDSEWGYLYCDNVIAWQELPDKYEG